MFEEGSRTMKVLVSVLWSVSVFLACLGVTAAEDQAEPFSVAVSLGESDGERVVSVSFSVQPHHYLYADRIRVRLLQDSAALVPRRHPAPKQKFDETEGKTVGVYDADVSFTYGVSNAPVGALDVEVSFQGCSETLCFFPTRETFRLGAGDVADPVTSVVPEPRQDELADWVAGWRGVVSRFDIGGRMSGYSRPVKFLAFLDRAESGLGPAPDPLRAALEHGGILLVVFLIIVGGLGLNLTPCVLPMIPVNIAIIGAGAQASSRGRGFALGGAYGAGIAITYGLLGVIVVLTGSRFGLLNASPWFNLPVAVLFFVLALAMFDVFSVDLSRLQGSGSRAGARRGSLAAAAGFGSVAALLAGACVAPVVIGVLLLSSDLYARGQAVGLLLPFLLGVGMALPWPFAGAGLSFLPKPGKWMTRVKIVFGIVILAVAVAYGRLGVVQLLGRSPARRAAVEAAQAAKVAGGWHESLEPALREGVRIGKPVFVDFWASSCTSCLKMEKTTFRHDEVARRLIGRAR